MTEFAHLPVFFVVVLGVVLLPGLDMAFVLGSALTGGRRQGLVAVAGMVAGGACHVTVGALGLGALIAVVPAAFNAVLLAGALYVAWIGVAVLRSEGRFGAGEGQPPRPLGATFREAVLTNLLNPKAYAFMLAIFPQFLRPAYGALWVQAVVLGAIIAGTQAAVYGGVALGAGGMRGWLARNPSAGTVVHRVVGATLVLAAAATALEGWR